MTRAALLVLLVAGCWRDPPPVAPEPPMPQTATVREPPATPTGCEAAVDQVLSILEPAIAAQLAPRRAAIVEHCGTMQWSDDALQCIRDAQEPSELDHCRDRFSDEQLNDLEHVILRPTP